VKLMLKDVRLAFPDIFEAKAFQGEGAPSFGATCLIDPGTQAGTIRAVNAAIEQVAKEKWGAKADAILKTLRATNKVCLYDGDAKAEYEGFEGMMYVAARSKTRPTVIDRDRSPVTAADGKIYSGCYANVQVEFWAQDNGFGKRVNAQLKGVQFSRDGDAFSGGGTPAAPDEFDDLSEGADADMELV
jgi:hypothetical protein